jgi:hypothetical protein
MNGPTIGIVLAQHELPARFDAAAERGDAAALRAWLDGLPGSVARGLSIGSAFERWAAARHLPDPRMSAAIRKLRLEVGNYEPVPPTLIRLVDDVTHRSTR